MFMAGVCTWPLLSSRSCAAKLRQMARHNPGGYMYGRSGRTASNLVDMLVVAGALLGDLLREVRPTDVGPLRSLARVHARQGNRAEARRIYTWCATRTDGSGFPRFDSAPTIPVRELIEEVVERRLDRLFYCVDQDWSNM